MVVIIYVNIFLYENQYVFTVMNMFYAEIYEITSKLKSLFFYG